MSANTSVFRVGTALVISANGAVGPAWPSEQADEVNVDVATTVAGTTVTLAVETSPDGGTTWFPHTTFAAPITVTGNSELKIPSNCGKLMRLVASAITGSFTADIWAVCKRRAG